MNTTYPYTFNYINQSEHCHIQYHSLRWTHLLNFTDIVKIHSMLLTGLILANGDINWNCPCLGGMASGPCGMEFRDAFSCFHYSTTEPKGSDCIDNFRTMQECMVTYPELYPMNDKSNPDESVDVVPEASQDGSEKEQVPVENTVDKENVS